MRGLYFFIFATAFVIVVQPSYAVSPTVRQLRQEIKEKKQNFIDDLKEKVKTIGIQARGTGTITAINGNTLTIQSAKGKTYQVSITSKTQLRRKFWGKATVSELEVGDTVNVLGKWIDTQKTQLDAILIRDTAIQKRGGVFFGEVIGITDTTIIIKTVTRGNLTVYTDAKSRLIARDENTIKFADIALGHRLRVKGVWDPKAKEIKEVQELKDFSLPEVSNKKQ